MTARIKATELLKAIDVVSGAVDRHSDREPMITFIYAGGVLHMIAANDRFAACAQVKADVEGEFYFALTADTVRRTLRGISAGVVTMKPTRDNVHVSTDTGVSLMLKITDYGISNYVWPFVRETLTPLFTLEKVDVATLKAVSTAALLENGDNKPILRNVRMTCNAEGLTFNAVDGYRLHSASRAGNYPALDVLLHRSALSTLKKCIGSGVAHVYQYGDHVMIEGSRGCVVFKETQPAHYPSFDRIVVEGPTVTVNAAAIIDRLAVIEKIVGRKEAVAVEYGDNTMTLHTDTVNTLDRHKYERVTLPVDMVGAPGAMTTRFRLGQFSDMIECFSGDVTITITTEGPSIGRVQLSAIEGPYSKRVVLMPLMR